MRSLWNEIPLLRITLLVIAGIAIEIVCDFTPGLSQKILWLMVPLLCLCGVFTLALGVVGIEKAYRLRYLNAVALSLLLVSAAYLLAWFYTEDNYKSHFQNHLKNQPVVVAVVIKPPVEKEKFINALVDVREVGNAGSHTKTSGKILLSFLRTGQPNNLRYGDVIAFSAKIDEFPGPKNPEEFNFKQYQAFHNVYHRCFAAPGSYRVIATGSGNVFMERVYSIRAYFLSVINRYVTDKNNFAVAAAIMLGYNDYMTTDVSRAYTNSGTLHVLSVSGLHVGIVFVMLNFLFGFMDKRGRKAQIAKATGIIAFIWFYACLTGLSPSVLRSALMFSMIQAGTTLLRHVNVYNIVAGSALLLMLFNPFIITEVGFQLSYLAVFGILFLYPKIYGLILIGSSQPLAFNRVHGYAEKLKAAIRHDWRWLFLYVLDFFWALTAVSVAAQIATLPLSLFCFHQFPNLFWLANLVVIPVSNLVLFAGTALCAVGEIPYLNAPVGALFNLLLTGLNKFTFLIDSIPFAVLEGISISFIEMVFIYLFLALACWLLIERRPKVLIAGLLIILGLVSFDTAESIQQAQQKKIVVYSVPRQKAIAFVSGTTVFADMDDSLSIDQKKQKFHIRPHWWKNGVARELPVAYKQVALGKIILFEGKTVLLIDTVLKYHSWQMDKKLKADLVIISHNPKLYISDLQKLCDFTELVFDSSNKRKRLEYWIQDCQKLNIKHWDVSAQGAYAVDIAK